MQDVEVSVLIELLAFVIWCDKCGVIKTRLIFQHWCLLRAPLFTIRQY